MPPYKLFLKKCFNAVRDLPPSILLAAELAAHDAGDEISGNVAKTCKGVPEKHTNMPFLGISPNFFFLYKMWHSKHKSANKPVDGRSPTHTPLFQTSRDEVASSAAPCKIAHPSSIA